MNRLKQAIVLLILAISIMLISIASTYTRTRHKMKDITYVKPTAYKVVN